MRILLVSDEESKYIWDFFDAERFRGVELIVSCGDLDPRYLSFLATMIPAPLVFVHGNHDHRYRTHPPEGCFSIDDKLFVYKGVRFLGLGGIRGLRGADRQEFTERQMAARIRRRFVDIKVARGVDVLVTHSPSAGVGDLPGGFHQGFETLRHFTEKVSPRYHFYGHVHLRYGATGEPIQFGNTTCINACGYKILDI